MIDVDLLIDDCGYLPNCQNVTMDGKKKKKLSYRSDNRALASCFHLIIILLTRIWLFLV